MTLKEGGWRGFCIVAGLAVLAALAPLAAGASSGCGVTWINATGISTGNILHGIAYGAGKYVAVGEGGTVISSVDGNLWTPHSTGTSDTLASVVYAAGKFVVVGGKTTLTSTDGLTWNKVQITSVDNLRSVAYGDGLFVAVGLNANIITSPDGVTWTTQYHYEGIDLNGIAFHNGQFVSVGQYGWTCTSIDGITFYAFNTGLLTNLRSVVYGQDQWICVGDNGDAFTSQDGLVWNQLDPHTNNHLYGVTYAAGLYVAVGKTGTIRYSVDTVTWDIAQSPSQADLFGIGYGGDHFIAVGQASALSNYCQDTHAISGVITLEGGGPASDVQVSLSGAATLVTHTDTEGNYSFDSLADGSYTLTPTSTGYVFVPPSLDVTLSGQDHTGANFTMKSAVTPPSISGVQKQSNPFRLKVVGSNFHPSATVRVNGTEVTTVYKSSAVLVAKSVASLIPKGSTVQITVINKDDGGISGSFSFTR